MALTERQLAQRRAASQAAALRRRTEGLTEAELSQRRRNAWVRGRAHRAAVNKHRKEVDERTRQSVIAQGGYFKLTRRQEDANINRLNKIWGIPIVTIIDNRLMEVPWSNPAFQSFLTKWSNARDKGLSADQAVDLLDRRWWRMRRRDRFDSTTMLDLVREFYPPGRREFRRHRRVLTERQREAKRLSDARYRESQRRRRAA